MHRKLRKSTDIVRLVRSNNKKKENQNKTKTHEILFRSSLCHATQKQTTKIENDKTQIKTEN